MRAHKLPALLGCLLVACPAAWCWGQTGHQVVAMIAEQRLSPTVKARVAHLLFDGKYSMAQISSCPDALRALERRGPRPEDQFCIDVAGQLPNNTGPWHYIDIPFETESGPLEPYCPDGACITAKIASFAQTLRDSQDDGVRRAALMFVIHFIGDINQPLHAIERNCDQGGNQEHVDFFLGDQERVDHRLHGVWDSDLLDKAMADAKASDNQTYAGSLNAAIKDSDAAKWAQETVTETAWDSHGAAVRYAYHGMPDQDFCAIRDALAKDPTMKPPAPHILDLKPAYERDGARVVREQLMKAGVQLAQILESNLSQ